MNLHPQSVPAHQSNKHQWVCKEQADEAAAKVSSKGEEAAVAIQAAAAAKAEREKQKGLQ